MVPGGLLDGVGSFVKVSAERFVSGVDEGLTTTGRLVVVDAEVKVGGIEERLTEGSGGVMGLRCCTGYRADYHALAHWAGTPHQSHRALRP